MTDVTNVNVFDQIAQLQAEAKQLINTNGKPILLQILQPYFDVSPQIEAVHWRQYTPYFNDGDPCVFHVNWEGEARISGTDDDVGDYEDGYLSAWYINYQAQKGNLEALGLDENHWTEERIQELLEVSKKIGKGFYNYPWAQDKSPDDGKYEMLAHQMFGDHVKVTVYRTGEIETEHYEHD